MFWLMGCLLFVLTAGFAKISTNVLNRILSIPQSKWRLALSQFIHLGTLPVYAYVLFDDLCLDQGRRIFDIQNIDPGSLFARLLVGLGVIGVVVLIRSTIAFQLYRPPECQISNHSSFIDFRDADFVQSWQETLIGSGPMRSLASLPGNEQFTLEVSIKAFELPRIPREWDGLSIVHLTDSHFFGPVSLTYYELVCEQAIALKPDIFVFTGDLLDDPSLLEWFASTFGRLKAPLGQYFVLGNHDWYQDTNAIRREFEKYGWIDLSSRTLELESLTAGPSILLAGDETPWMGEHPRFNASSSDQFRILLSHTPDNIAWARNQECDLVLAGHTHGGQIRLPILGPIYSPSRYGCRFASGVFWLAPTLLYVSRGLSGREPIRYDCVPELTKLVLKTPKDAGSAT